MKKKSNENRKMKGADLTGKRPLFHENHLNISQAIDHDLVEYSNCQSDISGAGSVSDEKDRTIIHRNSKNTTYLY